MRMTHEADNRLCQFLKVDTDQNNEEPSSNNDIFYEDGKSYNDDESDSLGPLPSKWEKAYTSSGEVYFIDHSTSTSHWLDPRLSKFQKKSLEDCLDDELPYGWEKICDPNYGTYFIDHVNRRTQYENPVIEAKRAICQQSAESSNTLFTRNPNELWGQRIKTSLVKSSRGLGFTIVGGDDDTEEFLQIKSVVPKGPAWLNGQLQTGDVIVYVNNQCVLGFTHIQIVRLFQSINVGATVTLEVCRGYPLPFDPNDPNTEVVTTVAVDSQVPHSNRLVRYSDSNYNLLNKDDGLVGKQSLGVDDLIRDVDNLSNHIEVKVNIVKGNLGFGFTIADSACGQRVKQILDRQRCKNLIEGDILSKINDTVIKTMAHDEVVQILKNLPYHVEAVIEVERIYSSETNVTRKIQQFDDNLNLEESKSCNGSKTPMTDMFSTYPKETTSARLKKPLADARTLSASLVHDLKLDSNNFGIIDSKRTIDIHSDDESSEIKEKHLHENSSLLDEAKHMKGTQMVHQMDCRCCICSSLNDEFEKQGTNYGNGKSQEHTFTVVLHKRETGFGFRIVGGIEDKSQVAVGHIVIGGAADTDGRIKSGDEIVRVDGVSVVKAAHRQVVRLINSAAGRGKVILELRRRIYPHAAMGHSGWLKDTIQTSLSPSLKGSFDITIHRNEDEGFGFVIISSSNKQGSTIGRLIENSPAEKCGGLHVGDHIIAVNQINITHLSHGDIVGLIKESGLSVTLTIASSYDI